MRVTRRTSRTLVHALPDEVVAQLIDFLVGVDIFVLSHVNRCFYRQLSGADVWTQRVHGSANLSATVCCWQKHAYALSRSFISRPCDTKGVRQRGYRGCIWQERGETIDVWFCLLPEYIPTKRSMIGVMCSVTRTLKVRVKVERWYHIAWCFTETETVYLNGEQVGRCARHGQTVRYNWDQEVRTNFFGVLDPLLPFREDSNNYVVHGLVDAFRHWGTQLSHDQVRRLARYEDVDSTPQATIKDHKAPQSRVFASRPLEEVGAVVRRTRAPALSRVPWYRRSI